MFDSCAGPPFFKTSELVVKGAEGAKKKIESLSSRNYSYWVLCLIEIMFGFDIGLQLITPPPPPLPQTHTFLIYT